MAGPVLWFGQSEVRYEVKNELQQVGEHRIRNKMNNVGEFKESFWIINSLG